MKTLIILLVAWAALVGMAVEVYLYQPEWRVFALLISWFGGVVSVPLLQAIYREARS